MENLDGIFGEMLQDLEKSLNEVWIPQLDSEGKKAAAGGYILDLMSPVFRLVSTLSDKEMVEEIIKAEIAHVLAQITRRLEIPDSLLTPGAGGPLADRVYDLIVDEVKAHFRERVSNN